MEKGACCTGSQHNRKKIGKGNVLRMEKGKSVLKTEIRPYHQLNRYKTDDPLRLKILTGDL
jgi:hypothetical protein